ncbi:hypothetical protein FKM82_023356 [Ascaphus truei]
MLTIPRVHLEPEYYLIYKNYILLVPRISTYLTPIQCDQGIADGIYVNALELHIDNIQCQYEQILRNSIKLSTEPMTRILTHSNSM